MKAVFVDRANRLLSESTLILRMLRNRPGGKQTHRSFAIATDSRADGYKRAQLAFTDSPRPRARSCNWGQTGLEKSVAVAGGN
jgi:hypothetical protein